MYTCPSCGCSCTPSDVGKDRKCDRCREPMTDTLLALERRIANLEQKLTRHMGPTHAEPDLRG